MQIESLSLRRMKVNDGEWISISTIQHRKEVLKRDMIKSFRAATNGPCDETGLPTTVSKVKNSHAISNIIYGSIDY